MRRKQRFAMRDRKGTERGYDAKNGKPRNEH
jgi:hypothetical protein